MGRTEEETDFTRAKMEDLLKVLVGADVNQGSFQENTLQVNLYKLGHTDQTWELFLLLLLPP